MKKNLPKNREIADLLVHIASLLELQEANTFRVQAYRAGAGQIINASFSIAELALDDKDALMDMPYIGEGLANLIIEYIETGSSSMLQRLEGELNPEALFESVPGIGTELAGRIVRELNIKTLAQLEQAVYDGRLAKVEGFGKKRLDTVRYSLAGMIGRTARTQNIPAPRRRRRRKIDRPSVSLLLEIDEEYRHKAKNQQLKKIAPRRFNPENRAWLPILHTEKDGWSFTALYSNTSRAHELEKTRDWVVIFYEKDQHDGQSTVVTETRGVLEGKRVVRGREQECMELEDQEAASLSTS